MLLKGTRNTVHSKGCKGTYRQRYCGGSKAEESQGCRNRKGGCRGFWKGKRVRPLIRFSAVFPNDSKNEL